MEIFRARRIVLLSMILALLGILVSILLGFQIWRLNAANAEMQSRLRRLEDNAHQRQVSDPLEPMECSVSFGNGTGGSPEQACNISIWRLLSAPQQFDGKWVRVQGKYHTGFEQNVLYDVDYDLPPALSNVFLQPRFALWIDTNQRIDESSPRVTLVGLYRRGPSGHLSQYGGRLERALAGR